MFKYTVFIFASWFCFINYWFNILWIEKKLVLRHFKLEVGNSICKNWAIVSYTLFWCTCSNLEDFQIFVRNIGSYICHKYIIYLVCSNLEATPIFVHNIGSYICHEYILYFAWSKHQTILTDKSCLFMIWYLYHL